jgi:serine/threonine-protein kinase
MSVVYLAEHPRLKNAVALKLLAPNLAEDDAFRERLIAESRLAASLNHPNVIPIVDTGEEDGVLFISMRYVDGDDLRALLKERGPLPLEEVVPLVAQIAAALDAAHARGLVHRDVKPANVLVERAGHVYVADFGLTKHVDARSGATASGQFVGTIDYMAPEQIQGRQVDGRADVYSLGCVLFECLTGRPPFRGENDVAVIWSHMRDDPPRPTDVDRRLPRSLDAVVERALAKDASDRYATCGDLARDVAAAVGDRRRRMLPRVRRPRVRARRRWLVPALAGAVAGAVVAGSLALGLGGGAATRTVLRRPAPRRALTVLDRSLLREVPPAIRGTCGHADPPTPDFDVSLVCRPHGAAATSVRYNHALGGARMKAQLTGSAYANRVARTGAAVLPVGACGTAENAVRDWTEPAPGRRMQILPHVAGAARGRLLCYGRNGWYAIEWTDTLLDVYSVAYGGRPGALYRWWQRSAGPVA